MVGAAFAAAGHTYRGRTDQTASAVRTFTLVVNNSTVTAIGFNAVFASGSPRCSSFVLYGDNELYPSFGFTGFEIKRHVLSVKNYWPDRSESDTIVARFEGKTVTGWFRVNVVYGPGTSDVVRCSTGKVGFTARW
jgi:hypothetical protein